MKMLPVLLLLLFQLEHLHALCYNYSSPVLSFPACNKEQLVHKGNIINQETETVDKVVSNVNRHAIAGGHGGGHAGAAHGGSHGRGVGGHDSNVLPKYGGVVAGAGGGGVYRRNHHKNSGNSSVSGCCVHPFYQLILATVILLWPISFWD